MFIRCLCALCAHSQTLSNIHRGSNFFLAVDQPSILSAVVESFVCCTLPLLFDAFNVLAEAEEHTVVNWKQEDSLSATCWDPECRNQPLTSQGWMGCMNERRLERKFDKSACFLLLLFVCFLSILGTDCVCTLWGGVDKAEVPHLTFFFFLFSK